MLIFIKCVHKGLQSLISPIRISRLDPTHKLIIHGVEIGTAVLKLFVSISPWFPVQIYIPVLIIFHSNAGRERIP